jgi:hypothetical protein
MGLPGSLIDPLALALSAWSEVICKVPALCGLSSALPARFGREKAPAAGLPPAPRLRRDKPAGQVGEAGKKRSAAGRKQNSVITDFMSELKIGN